jgi:hypothetical protein
MIGAVYELPDLEDNQILSRSRFAPTATLDSVSS